MIEIITDEVKMPEDSREWKYKKFKSTIVENVWYVYDTEKGEPVYKGSFDNAALACHNLNKKHYINILNISNCSHIGSCVKYAHKKEDAKV